MNIKDIVITEDHYNALGIVRSLGENNIEVILILTTESNRTYVDKSKYVSRTIRIGHDVDRIIQQINFIASDSSNYYVFPLSDFAAEIVDKHYREFSSNVTAPQMGGKMLYWQDKEISKNRAKACGLYTAKSKIFSFSQSAEDLEWNVFPAIVKPVVSIEGAKSDITIVNNQGELFIALQTFDGKNYSRVLVEEYIHSDDDYMIEVLGYSAHGKAEISGIVKKKREYPMRRGSTSFAKLVDHLPNLDLDNICKYIESVGYDGLFDVEFKSANSIPYFIECNFRNGAPSYALTLVGRNLPILWINNKCGNNILSCRPQNNNCYFMCEQTDVINLLKREVGIKEWVHDFRASNKIFWNAQDRKPAAIYYRMFIADMIKRFWRKLSND